MTNLVFVNGHFEHFDIPAMTINSIQKFIAFLDSS